MNADINTKQVKLETQKSVGKSLRINMKYIPKCREFCILLESGGNYVIPACIEELRPSFPRHVLKSRRNPFLNCTDLEKSMAKVRGFFLAFEGETMEKRCVTHVIFEIWSN